MKQLLSLLLCLTTALFLFGCGKKEDTPDGKTFYCYLPADPVSLDPQVAVDEPAQTVLQNLFEGLVRLDGDGLATPGVAKSWSVDEERTVYTFLLRADAKWCDGTPLTADDFVYGMQRAVDPRTKSATASQLFCIKNAQKINEGELPLSELGVEAVDRTTLRITLEYSYEDFPSQTARLAFMPCNRTFFESTGGKYGMEAAEILTNGPFALRAKSGWVHDGYLRLIKNERYVGENEVRPAGILMTVKTVDDPLEAIGEGKADVAAVSAQQAEQARELGVQVETFMDTTWGLCFNTANAVFGNETMRRAFLLALSRESLFDSVPVNCVRGDDIVPPETGYLGRSYREAAGACALPTSDPAASVQLLAQGLSELGLTKLPTVTVLCVNDEETKMTVNVMLGEWRNTLGYYFNLEAVTQAELERRVAGGNYQLALVPVRASEDGPRSFISAVLQAARGSVPEIDALSPRLYSDTVAAAKEAEQLLLDRGIFYPLYYQSRYYAIQRGITDLVVFPYGGFIDFYRAGKLEQK